MKNYVKPVVLENDEIFEGVYAASGALNDEPSEPNGENPEIVGVEGDCWTVVVEPEVRADLDGGAGGYKNFRVKAEHSKSVTHISTSTTVVITFSTTITEAYWEHQWGENTGSCSINGNVVTVTRNYHANGYYSGDNYDSVLKVRAENDDLTLALTVSNATISGVKTPNVQGGWD